MKKVQNILNFLNKFLNYYQISNFQRIDFYTDTGKNVLVKKYTELKKIIK